MKEKARELCNNKQFDLTELLVSLYNIELESIDRFSKIYAFNSDCFSNVEYLNLYNHAHRKLENEIFEIKKQLITESNEINAKFCKNWIDSNYLEVEEASSIGIKEYLSAFNNFLNNYSNVADNKLNSLAYLTDFLEIKRDSTYKNLISTMQHNIKISKEKDVYDPISLKEKLKILTREQDALQEEIADKEQNLLDLDSDLAKQKRKICDMKEEIDELEKEFKQLQKEENV